jgi:hypothetical protein
MPGVAAVQISTLCLQIRTVISTQPLYGLKLDIEIGLQTYVHANILRIIFCLCLLHSVLFHSLVLTCLFTGVSENVTNCLKCPLATHLDIWHPTMRHGFHTSNIEIMERFQSKALRLITAAPWYVPNAFIRNDLQIPTIKEEITRLSSKCSAGLNTQPNRNQLNSRIHLPSGDRGNSCHPICPTDSLKTRRSNHSIQVF